jgi:hypothetical protein
MMAAMNNATTTSMSVKPARRISDPAGGLVSPPPGRAFRPVFPASPGSIPFLPPPGLFDSAAAGLATQWARQSLGDPNARCPRSPSPSWST